MSSSAFMHAEPNPEQAYLAISSKKLVDGKRIWKLLLGKSTVKPIESSESESLCPLLFPNAFTLGPTHVPLVLPVPNRLEHNRQGIDPL